LQTIQDLQSRPSGDNYRKSCQIRHWDCFRRWGGSQSLSQRQKTPRATEKCRKQRVSPQTGSDDPGNDRLPWWTRSRSLHFGLASPCLPVKGATDKNYKKCTDARFYCGIKE